MHVSIPKLRKIQKCKTLWAKIIYVRGIPTTRHYKTVIYQWDSQMACVLWKTIFTYSSNLFHVCAMSKDYKFLTVKIDLRKE